MQATPPHPNFNGFRNVSRKLSYFLVVPLTAFVLFTLTSSVVMATYQSRHDGRVYTGINVWGVDLSGMRPEEARAALAGIFPYTEEEAIQFTDPTQGGQWVKSPAELGLSLDLERTVDEALNIGRAGGLAERFREMFTSWYYGYSLAPVLVVDEGKLDHALTQLASELEKSAVSAELHLEEDVVAYTPGQPGRSLDVADLRQRLLAALTEFRRADIELLVHDTLPAIHDSEAIADQIKQMTGSPIFFYLQEPLDDLDLRRVELGGEELGRWLRAQVVTGPDGRLHHEVFLDENAARQWLSQLAEDIYREPVNARFYFNDSTRELVLVAPHVNGRELDVEATLARFMEQVKTPDRSVPFVVQEIVPTVHSGANAADLGITELVSEKTTWFRGSTDARKHNIARAAANFYGIVIAPDEEFSFNRYLGSISEADGYEEGLIIVGGRTIKGIGGGVCQVSTTMFQTAFWSGFPIIERWEHGYMLGYYNDGEGPGMDATVYSPIVDLRFINNTPYHLLIENYYDEENEALTFKFYSTSMGRTIEKVGPVFENIVPAPTEDIWELDEELELGTVTQIDWATEGADVTVQRIVYNANGDEIINELFTSHYIPYANVYHYGPGVNAPDYSLVPPDHR